MRQDIKEGSIFPDYELPDHTDTKRKLSFLQGNNPMILMLGRGFFCPKERQHLHQLVQFYDQCVVGYTQLVTITTDSLLSVNELRQGVGAYWPFLYDEDRTIAHDLDILEYTDTIHNPMMPFTIVLEPGLKIYKIYDGYWYWGRPSMSELHQDLREITKRIRPDYKIDTAEMRKKWEQNEKSDFFPYQESMKKVMSRMSGDWEHVK